MLFDTSISESATVIADVEPSKYEANLEGALMCVYENECNYNALMKAAGLSELKYYKETAGDLFLNEAGAFGGFLSKAKEFFKKVIEKIKALFKKFFMTINKFFMSDKEWVKKYEKDILRVTSIKDFEFKGYKFNKANLDSCDITGRFNNAIDQALKGLNGVTLKDVSHSDVQSVYKDEDEVDDKIESLRGSIVNQSSADEAEFRDYLKEYFYGDTEKDVLDDSDISLRQQLQYIKDTKESTKSAEKVQKALDKKFKDIFKAFDEKIKEFGKFDDAESKDTTNTISKSKNDAIKACNQYTKILKSLSNDSTVMSGMLCQALKDRNRQAKAICIKAVSYGAKHKNESAMVTDSNDLFAGVTIR